MENKISNRHRVFLIISFFIVVIGFLLCVNYFFVSDMGEANLVANIALTLAFLATIWYMIKGYKIPSDSAFYVPLFMYVVCVIVMISTATVSISVATPFVTASLCTLIVYPVIIAFNQHRFKLCITLFILCLASELGSAAFIFFLYGPDGIIDGGNIVSTLNNVHIFVRSFLTSALALCYVARYVRLKK